jgi:hypothetical protein
MRINGIEYFYDIGRQKYVMFLESTQEIVRVEKEHIFKAYIAQHGIEEYRRNKKEILDKIELKYLVFDPHNSREWVKNKFTYKNTFLMSSSLRIAKTKREKSSLSSLNNNLNFLKKYPHINLLLDNLFVSDSRKEYFINWLSSAFNTMNKNRTAIILRGIPGAGKNVLYEQIIEYALGQNYCVIIGNDDLATNFNISLENKLFVLANEIKGNLHNGNTAYEKVKQYITEAEIRVEQKGVDSRKIINYFNMLIFSNNQTPLQIQGDDRRYTVYETNNIPLKEIIESEFKVDTFNYIKAIQSERDDFIIDLIMYNYDINKAQKCQETEEKERIYRASMTKIEILSDKIKSNDKHFFDDILEILEDEDKEELFSFFRDKKIPITNESVADTFKYIVSDINKDYKENIIKNNYLIFLYNYFVSKSDSGTKRGSNLSSFFGKSKNTSKQIRYRYISTIEKYKAEKEASELF